MGGLLSLKISIIDPQFFKGTGLIAPFMGFKDKNILASADSTLIRVLDRLIPWFRLPLPQKARSSGLST
jgi:hypothetical protein